MFLSYYYLALVACQKMVITNTQMKNVAYIYIYILFILYIIYVIYMCYFILLNHSYQPLERSMLDEVKKASNQ